MAKTFLTKKNNAKSTLAAGITNVATSLSVQTGDGAKFPAAPFHATLYVSDPATSEIIKVTAKTTDTFTITRAQEGTTAQAFNAGDKVELLVTAKLFDDFQTRTEVVVATDGSGDYNTDGTADQTEIQEAIDNLPAGGGIVRLKQGTYTINAAISILKSNVILEGEGAATVLKMANATNLDYMVAIGNGGVTAYHNCVIRNIQFDANKANQTTGTGSGPIIYGASATKNTRNIIENCWVHDSRVDSVRLIGAENCMVRGCAVWNAGGSGIGVFTSSQYNAIYGNTLSSNGYGIYASSCNYNSYTGNTSQSDGYGIYLTGEWRAAVSGNVIFTPTNYGIYLTGTQRIAVTGNHVYAGSWGILVGNSASATQYNVVTGNTFAWQSTVGIAIYGGSGGAPYNTVSGNAVYGSGQHGIYIYRASYNTVNGNVVDGASRNTNNTYNSIYLSDDGITYSTYNIVTGNNCQASQANKAAYHIRENAAGDDFNLVISNICKDGATGQISLQGSNSVRGTNIPASG